MRAAPKLLIQAAVAFACVLPLCCGGRSAGERDSADGAAPDASCTELCERLQMVSCGDSASSCAGNCDDFADLATSRACSDEVNAQRSCRLDLPVESFLCVDGVALAGESCVTTDAAFLECLSRDRGDYGACERVCELDVVLSCSNATEVANCPENCSNVSRLGRCSDEALAWYGCVAKHPPEELRCQANIIRAADGNCDEQLALFTACRP